MTETERKALALVNEVARELGWDQAKEIYAEGYTRNEALFRAIERHEAFRQEVSFALETFKHGNTRILYSYILDRFIIAKPDPLVEVLKKINGEGGFDGAEHQAHSLRSAIEERGGRIVWGEG